SVILKLLLVCINLYELINTIVLKWSIKRIMKLFSTAMKIFMRNPIWQLKRNKKLQMKKYLITGTLLLSVGLLHAQQGFVSVGGDTNTGSGSVSFSVGQLEYNHFSNAGFLVIEGLQQPFEVS